MSSGESETRAFCNTLSQTYACLRLQVRQGRLKRSCCARYWEILVWFVSHPGVGDVMQPLDSAGRWGWCCNIEFAGREFCLANAIVNALWCLYLSQGTQDRVKIGIFSTNPCPYQDSHLTTLKQYIIERSWTSWCGPANWLARTVESPWGSSMCRGCVQIRAGGKLARDPEYTTNFSVVHYSIGINTNWQQLWP